MDVKNPFLFDDPAPTSAGEGSDVGNPFLNGGGFDFSATSYSGINPFSDQVDETAATAMNIFGDDSATYVPDINPFGVTANSQNMFDAPVTQETSAPAEFDIFGSMPSTESQAPVDLFGAPPPQPAKPPPPRPPSPSSFSSGMETNTTPTRPPPPRPPPPSKETKDLLQTVIGAMEATTDTLQDKLNTTVSPCPSPGGGTHTSRSPTPDIHITAPDKEPDAFSTIFGQTIELSDQEVDESHSSTGPISTTTEPITTVAKSEAPTTTTDEIDLFGEPIPQTKPKTTQDILSLFNKPAETTKQQVDLLSDDLISDDTAPQPGKQNVETKEEIKGTSEVDLLSELEPSVSESPDKIEEVPPSLQVTEKVGEVLDDTKTDESVSEIAISPEQTSEKSDSEHTVIESSPVLLSGEEDLDSQNKDVDVNKAFDDAKEIECFASPDKPQPEPQNEEPPVTFEESNIVILGSEEIKRDQDTPFPENVAPVINSNEPVDGPVSIPAQITTQVVSPPAPTSDFAQPEHENVNVFGVTNQVPPLDISAIENVFGTKSEKDPASPFFGIPESTAPHTTPSSATSIGFDIFGGGEPAPVSPLTTVPSGAETTGATLFETAAPAPNVGMSLFGAGEEASLDIFAESAGNTMINPFAPPSTAPTSIATLASVTTVDTKATTDEEFDAFSARFDNVTVADAPEVSFDPFTAGNRAASPWGDGTTGAASDGFGFGDDTKFDPFLALNEPPPPPQSTPRKVKRDSSKDSDETPMNVVIRPAAFEGGSPVPPAPSPVPVLAPPPAALSSAFTDSSPRFNPFDKSGEDLSAAVPQPISAFPGQGELQRSESQETPPTPLFEEDQSEPLEPFPRTAYDGRTWEMHLRQPNKKKITGQRFWKKVFVKMTDAGALQLFNNLEDKEPFQELPLQPCYSVSDIGAQQFDQFGKIFTVKLQYIFYKERPGVRPGQISKAERITNKLSKFAQYAIAGDYEGVKEFASDVRKLGMPVEHAPQISQLLKLGTQNYEDLKLFASLIEEFMFKLTVHRDRALTYKSEEVQLTAVDEMYVESDFKGVVNHMVARVRIFFLGFLTGMPEVDLGINDLRKQGHEVVGRHDIIPVITEEWIRLEDIEFHCTVNNEEFEVSRHIKFKPPDACYIELMRFRVRPPKNRELPLQVKTKFMIEGKRVEIHSEILVPGFSGRKLGQVPCEDVAVRFPLPECWIYMFRVEKHFRYGSVKSAHRRTGKVKGIERFKGAVDAPEAALMEVTSGLAKYEHQHRAIVWRMSRLPKEGQGAYTVHQFSCKMNLTAYDQVPQSLDRFCMVEFTMPATTVSHCVMRSVSVTSEDPPEKYVRYLARHEYKVEIEFTSGSGPNEYLAATMSKDSPKEGEAEKKPVTPTLQEESSSDDSS